ncbi:hypothetical protein D041_4073A, partial [Vibrio parahaemolyticus EKP-008]
MGGFGD